MEAILRKEIVVSKALSRSLGVFVFIILTALGAYVRIPLPFTPVPITLQTFFVLLCGAFLGSSLGLLSQAGYLALGVMGVPFFTGAGIGAAYLLGPTGGYLFGFIIAAFLAGRFLRNTGNNLTLAFLALLAADLAILLSGAVWLKFIFGFSFLKALAMGALPFIPGDVCKAFAAAVIYTKLKNRTKEIF